jgi:hypothetical protein
VTRRESQHPRHKERRIGAHVLKPESQMMGYGYDPMLSEGAIKPPLFQTSTFVFESAEAGKRFFELAHGQREPGPGETAPLIYSRLNNPDTEILEDRLTLWDDAEAAAVFDSGMAAISTTLLAFLRPEDVLLHSDPLYGGTEHFLEHVLTDFGVSQPAPFSEGETVVVPDTSIHVEEGAKQNLVVLNAGVSLGDLVAGLNALGVTPQDLIAILQAIRSAGALNAELELM